MNPEFERNVWLELTPFRMAVMAAVLALVFFAAALVMGAGLGPGVAARWAYYIIVVIWGSRNAALSVVGEIRARTWDGQRLSSLRADTMMWGKLFGSTILNWFGGALCLAVIVAGLLDRRGPLVALDEFVYYVAIGVIAQSASLLASLIAAGRRQAHTQFEVVVYQAAGLVAAVAVYIVWSFADPVGSGVLAMARADTILWWGRELNAQAFLLLSVAAFTGWMLTGCYRQMRLELKMKNGPYVWLAFLAFIGVYMAGFDSWLSYSGAWAHLEVAERRLVLAGLSYTALAYVMALLEHKDRVRYRWLGAELGKLHLGAAFGGLQAWMMSYLAAFVAGITLVGWLGSAALVRDQAVVVAGLGFLTRDMAILVLVNVLARRGGDFAALAVLFVLYALLPAIFGGIEFIGGEALFEPRAADPLWLSPVAAWIEALLVAGFAIGNLALPEEVPKPQEATPS